MYSPTDQSLEEFYKHQELLLPYTSTWIGRTNLDIGCGTGLTSVIWPAPGSEDTELGVFMGPEVGHGETKVYTGVQA